VAASPERTANYGFFGHASSQHKKIAILNADVFCLQAAAVEVANQPLCIQAATAPAPRLFLENCPFLGGEVTIQVNGLPILVAAKMVTIFPMTAEA